MLRLIVPIVSIALILVVTSRQATAQFDVNGPNAVLTVQGEVPSGADPVDHDVVVITPGIFQFRVFSYANTNMGVVVLASSFDPSGAQFATPWGGSIDIGSFPVGPGSITVVTDGIGLSVNPATDVFARTAVGTASFVPSYGQSIALGSPALCGFRIALQCVVQDPTNPPFNLDNTEAADAVFDAGSEQTLLTGADGFVVVPFVTGHTFPFHGVSYTSVFVFANGYVTFQNPTNTFIGSLIDPLGWVNDVPSIAAYAGDWNPTWISPTDGVRYRETNDAQNGGFQATISWGRPYNEIWSMGGALAHFELDLLGQAGTAPCQSPTAQPGRFAIRWPSVFQNIGFAEGDGFFGHTPGGAVLALSGAATFSNDLLGQNVTTAGGRASVEEHNSSGTNVTTLGTAPLGVPRAYNDFYAVRGREVVFTPTAALGLTAGASGYTSTPSSTPADDVVGVFGSVVASGPGTVATIVGKFFGFGNGTVDLIDVNGVVTSGLPGTVISGAGPIFANEGLVVNVPPLGIGDGLLRVNFASGYTETIPMRVVSPCATFRNLLLGSAGFAAVTLASPTSIVHYGVGYGQIFVGKDGLITMNAPNTDSSSTMAEFFSGPTQAGNPAVAAYWTNLSQVLAIPVVSALRPPRYFVIEDACAGTVEVIYADQAYGITDSPAGTFSVKFGAMGPDSVRFDYSKLLADAFAGESAVVGISDGSSAVGAVKTDLATLGGIQTVFPGYASTTGPESIGEDIPTTLARSRLQQINGNGIFTIRIVSGLITVF